MKKLKVVALLFLFFSLLEDERSANDEKLVLITFNLLHSIIFDDLRFAHYFHSEYLSIMSQTNLYHISKSSTGDDIDHLEVKNDRFLF